MSAVVLNPTPNSNIRIITRECEKAYSDHKRCPGTIHQPGVTFTCECQCHKTLQLFDGGQR